MGEEFSTWDYPGDFLDQFPPHYQGVVGDIFCRQVRAGAQTVERLLAAVGEQAYERLYNPYESDTPEALEARRVLFSIIATPEARRFAEFILWREALPHAERHKLKEASRATKGDVYAKKAMAGKPPTDKQLSLLKAKGCKVIPRDRLEASELIGKYLNG